MLAARPERTVLALWFALCIASCLVAAPAPAAWETILDLPVNLQTISFAPDDADRIFVGTWGWGLYRSPDGGATWQSDVASFQTPSGNDNPYVFEVLLNAAAPDQGICITRNGTYVSSNGGISWTVHSANFSDACPTVGYAVIPIPDGSGAVLSEQSTGVGGSRLFSYRWDTNEFAVGATSEQFRDLTDGEFLGIGFGVDGRLYVGHATKIYWTTDLGETLVKNGPGLPSQITPRSVVPDPVRAGAVIVTIDDGMFRQETLQGTWQPWGVGLPAPARAVMHHPGNPEFMIAGTNFGVFASDDRGATWSPLTDEGLTHPIVADVAIDSDDPRLLYAAVNNVARTAGSLQTLRLDTVVSIDDPEDTNEPAAIAMEFALAADRNPFDASTRLSFRLDRAAATKVDAFDTRGRRVRTLVDATMPAGEAAITWTGLDDAGRRLAGGVYFVRLLVDGVLKDSTKLTLRR